ncbi:MAG: hypothetical protein GXO23_03635 [Crenarchaeota archaeon]|nr:hypothetical protein [Thermoproteota archaeon]
MPEEFIRETLIDRKTLLIEPSIDLTYLSSGMFGGLVKRRGIIIRTVDPDFHVDNVREWCLKNVLDEIGREDYIVLLTAVEVEERVKIEDRTKEGYRVSLISTIGFSPVACIERKYVYTPLKGTINIIVLTDAELAPQALVDLYRTVTEAKTAAIADTLLSCESRPTGTVTDTVTVGAPLKDDGFLTCGVATTVGNLASKLVYKAILWRYLEYYKDYLSNIDIGRLIDDLLIRELVYRRHILRIVLNKDDRARLFRRNL